MMRGPYQQQLPSLEAFYSGEPERIVMTDNPGVALTWLHTNELSAPTVAHALYSKRPDLGAYVNYICGNPHTAKHAPDQGFTHSDLNRSFGKKAPNHPQTYEEHRAEEVLDFIADAEHVLDVHNTVCTNFGKAIIVDERLLHTDRIRRIIAASPIMRILVMSEVVADECLIGESGQRAVTFEYEMGPTADEAVPDTLQTIETLLTGRTFHEPFEREVFRVSGTIPKADDPGLDTKNFEPFVGKDGQTHYAVFLGTGPRSYREDITKDYCGFYATMEHLVL